MSETSSSPAPGIETICHICGQEAAMVVDGNGWCASCVHARGSCCAESEMEDDDEPSASCQL